MGALSVLWRGYSVVTTTLTITKLGIYGYLLYMMASYLGTWSLATMTTGLIFIIL